MNKTVSLSDLRLLPALSKYSEWQIIHPRFDKFINECLETLGMDLQYAWEYVPSKHRNRQGKAVVGYQCVEEINVNSAYLHSSLATMEERLIGAYLVDPSLCMEMCQLMGSHTSFKDDVCASEDDGADWPAAYTESDYKQVSRQIRELEEYRDKVRGENRNEDGSLKTPEQYMKLWIAQGVRFV